MTDTESRGIARWHVLAFPAVAAVAAFTVALMPDPAWPKDTHSSRVLWTHADRVYIALGDGSRSEEGDSVRFEDRGKPVAGGLVSSIVHGELAVVSLTSGSLERVKKLERVRVSLARPPIAARSSLRIALPSNDRDNLLFRCGEVAPRLPAETPAYRSERVDGRSLRLIREGPLPASLWPDTLHVFLFDDARDEEIALERGDVDVAVFWPGELAPRIREDARWHGFLLGSRSRGILALAGENIADAAPDSARAGAFNEGLFRGDLALRELRSHAAWAGGGVFWDFDIDRDLPGRVPMWSWIRIPPSVSSVRRPPARLLFLDAPGDTSASPTLQPLFRLRCPVVCVAPLRPLVRALGADAFADMPDCRPAAAAAGP